MSNKRFIFDGISLPLDSSDADAKERVSEKLRKAGIRTRGAGFDICKKIGVISQNANESDIENSQLGNIILIGQLFSLK